MHAARQFDELVDQVRALPATALFPEPEWFLKAPPIRDLLPRVDDDPVVVINISRWRCDALILNHRGVTLVELPGLTEQQVINEANVYLDALHDFEDSQHTAVDRLVLEMAITTTLQWLWDQIAAPILTAMGHTTALADELPRLWWCPTGALTILPMHSAGHHHTTNTVYDRVVSSYTPTLRALHHARAVRHSSRAQRMLIVSIPNTPGQSRLPGASTEQALLAARFAGPERTVLTDTQANRAAILTQLGRHRWLHTSCHGTQNLVNPSAGGLLPYDWQTAGLITVADLTAPGHPGGEFAFLSACKTATGGLTNLDEAINIAAAMQHAGWRHVIGTVGSVWDDTAATVTHDIYSQLIREGGLDPTNTAQALHLAIRRLRGTNPDRPSVWAPYIHIGP